MAKASTIVTVACHSRWCYRAKTLPKEKRLKQGGFKKYFEWPQMRLGDICSIYHYLTGQTAVDSLSVGTAKIMVLHDKLKT